MSFSIIAAIGKNRELGKNGQLLWHLPEDLRFFKKTTLGHPVLMGHKTFDSLPGVLPGRKHYVLTRKRPDDFSSDTLKGASIDGATATFAANAPTGSLQALRPSLWPDEENQVVLVPNLSDFIKNTPKNEEIFVIGGGMVYWEMLKYCDTLYLTEVDTEDKDADTFFPEFDKTAYNREVLGEGEQDGLKYVFAKYTKLN